MTSSKMTRICCSSYDDGCGMLFGRSTDVQLQGYMLAVV